MVSRENKVITGFVLLAIVLLFGIFSISNPPTWVGGAVILGIGVIAPTLINEYLNREDQT